MSKIIVVANQKGGVGKTTTAANLGAYIADAGHSVLLVDFDPQSNLSSSMGVANSHTSVYDVITHQRDAREVVRKTMVDSLDIIPSSLELVGATVELIHESRREYFLRDILKNIKTSYEYIFIDCPPSLGILTLNGLAAADSVLIPLQCEYFAMEGLAQLLRSIDSVQKQINPALSILGIVFTMYDTRTRLSQDIVKEVVDYFGARVLRTIIPRNVRLSEAPSHGVPINKYDPECVGAKSYQRLSMEILDNG